MSLSSSHWYAVLSSRELGHDPVGRTRFGERLGFWRGAGGRPAALQDRCAHRGAALSLGRVRDGALECAFHGFCYDATGQCLRVPVEPPGNHAAGLRVGAVPVAESDGWIWAWRGPAADPAQLPPPPRVALPAGLAWGESRYIWNAHYTRCIENVLDYSHLPYVHRTTLGRRIRNTVCTVAVEPTAAGFRARRTVDARERQFIELTYPNVWLNGIGDRFFLAASFAPIDDRRTETCVRWYYPRGLRWLSPLLDLLGALSQHVVFRDDWPIVESQRPRSVDDADSDRLVPSDAAIIAYRRLRRAHAAAMAPAPQ